MSYGRIVPVILAGGSGTRLWPISRDAFPKQFQPLVGTLSTYQQTLRRVAAGDLFTDPFVVTSDAFRFFAHRQAGDMGARVRVILEPSRRDSAAAMAVAALAVEEARPGAVMMALAADHVVLDEAIFREAVAAGLAAAEAGSIVVFGLVPNEPKTAYGYIRPGAALSDGGEVSRVDAFVEKPDLPTAIRYVEDGYLWNSGNFLFRAATMIRELERHAPGILSAAREALAKARKDYGFTWLDAEAFGKAEKKSIDYAVIEKAADIAVVRGRFRWSDVGAWDAIWQVADKDEAGNALHGDALAVDSRGCLVHGDGVLTTVVGADDLVVVASPDAVMVAPKANAQAVKALVDRVNAAGRSEGRLHRRDYRPWGYVERVDSGPRFQVKRIVVDPGGMLSLQRHMHRSEHWVVVRGTATVTVGEREDVLLTENESLYVPLGTTHRLANRGRIPLELIEVCTGTYIGEDDIERLEDAYSRA